MITVRRHILPILILFSLSCSREQIIEQPQQDNAPMVVALFNPYGLGDLTREDQICKGIMSTASREGLRTLLMSPYYWVNGVSSLSACTNRLKDDPAPHLYIIASGYDRYKDEIIRAVRADDHASLLLIDPNSEWESGASITVSPYASAYMAGVLAALIDTVDYTVCHYYSNDVGMNDIMQGFNEGFLSHQGTMIDNLDSYNPFLDEEEETLTCSKVSFSPVQYYLNQYADFVVFADKYQYRNILNCPEAADQYRFLGIDANVSDYSPKVPFSCVRHLDKATEHCIMQWLSAEGLPKNQWYGLDSEYSELILSPGYEYLQPSADSIYAEALQKERNRSISDETR